MAEIIGVRFKEVGKVYYFDPLDNKLNTGDRVIVETARGLECGEVATPNKTVDDAEISHPLKAVNQNCNRKRPESPCGKQTQRKGSIQNL